ncbi:MAG TPA: family 1 glycosylhydrolase, partial [Glaciibacter sp.]|nr:family 1 glycosylhydrolase [Glaciibacter sp.]
MSTTSSSTSGSAARAWQHRAQELGQSLPPGFRFGTATSAFPIEGGARDGGRGDSVWDAFTTQPGRIVDGSNASVSSDHFNRQAEDVTLLRELGGDTYRFSFAWPRLQPDGRGSLNADGLAFYDRLLDELLTAGISPMATLVDWDIPAALRGGWRNRDTAMRVGDYAFAVGEAFRDRIDAWLTLRAPAAVTLNGYALGSHAPGDTQLFDALPSAHHQLLGHGLAVQALRAADVRGQVGIANAYSPVQAASDREEDRVFADLYDALHNRIFSDPVLLGRYPELPEFSTELRKLAEVDPDDLRTIHQPLDFYGVDYTQPAQVAAGSGAAPPTNSRGGDSRPPAGEVGMARFPFRLQPLREFPVTGSGVANAPEFLGVTLAELQGRYGDALPPVYVTAGASFPDTMDKWGDVTDIARIDYLAEHLSTAVQAVAPGGIAEGVDLRG